MAMRFDMRIQSRLIWRKEQFENDKWVSLRCGRKVPFLGLFGEF